MKPSARIALEATSPLQDTPGPAFEHPNLDILSELFERARRQDEFEFVCTLLRVRGMEDVGWDTLEESWQLITQVVAQVEAPVQKDFRLRLLLFLYCHVTEMYDLYHLIGNLIRVTLGDRYTLAPFQSGKFGETSSAKYPASKVARIRKWSEDAGIPEIGELLNTILVPPVRNAFFHSDYVLFDNEFRIKRGAGVEIDGLETHKVPFDWLLPRVELAINLLLTLVELLRQHISSYQKPKNLRGRFAAGGGWADLELIVKEGYGVVGFRSIP